MSRFGEIQQNTEFDFGNTNLNPKSSKSTFNYCIKFIKGPGSITIDKTTNGYTVTLEALLHMKCVCESFHETPDIGGLGAWPQGCKGNKYKFYLSRSYPGGWCSKDPLPDTDVPDLSIHECKGNKQIKIKKTISMADFIAYTGTISGDICIQVTPANQSIVRALWLCGANYSTRAGDVGEPPYKVLCFNMYEIAECMGEAIFGKLLCEDSNEDTVADFITAYIDELNTYSFELGNCLTGE
jgi:hypothetical protein